MGHYFRAAMKEGGIAMSKISARRDMAIIAAVTLAAAVVAVSLVWFSSRRYFEANRQLLWRKAAEARLAEALARDLHDELGQYLNAMKIENLDAACGLALFRLVQEALTNIARHADATRVDMRIASAEPGASGRSVEILIADDGRGTDMSKPRTGLGLVGMRERIFALGGTIAFESEPGSGFEIRARLPLTATLSGLTSSLRFASSLAE